MSRCFPYPPPGYEGKSRDEALIESLKLQREKDKAKKEKKEKKEKKKEKEKREKKEKSKEYGKSEDKKHGSEERGKDRRNQINQERVDHKKRKHEEIEQVERSSVTEEHGQPAATPSLYDSSDSTQSSAKRKKHDLDTEAGHNLGSGLRIRLPLLKRKDPELSCNTEQACHSGRVDHLATVTEIASKFQPGNTVRACSSRRTDYLVEEPKTACALPRYEELACSSSRVDELAEKTEAPCNIASGSGSRIQKVESQFKELLEIWNPPQLLMDFSDVDNQEWLFESKQQCSQGGKQHKESDYPNSGSSSLWPRACYLPGADVYALPYAIPY